MSLLSDKNKGLGQQLYEEVEAAASLKACQKCQEQMEEDCQKQVEQVKIEILVKVQAELEKLYQQFDAQGNPTEDDNTVAERVFMISERRWTDILIFFLGEALKSK